MTQLQPSCLHTHCSQRWEPWRDCQLKYEKCTSECCSLSDGSSGPTCPHPFLLSFNLYQNFDFMRSLFLRQIITINSPNFLDKAFVVAWETCRGEYGKVHSFLCSFYIYIYNLEYQTINDGAIAQKTAYQVSAMQYHCPEHQSLCGWSTWQLVSFSWIHCVVVCFQKLSPVRLLHFSSIVHSKENRKRVCR